MSKSRKLAHYSTLVEPTTLDGRDLSVDGAKLDGIEVLADVTDTTNVTSAGALMLTGGDMTGDLTTTGSFIGYMEGAMVENCKNTTVSTILKGTPVYQTGTAGFDLEIAPSDASVSATMPAIGVLAQDLTAGSSGLLIHSGDITGVDTSAFAEADKIYVAVGGGYSNVAPTGEANSIQALGTITKVHASNGGGHVHGAGRVNATPNLDSGNVFIGNGSNQSSTRALTPADTVGLTTYLTKLDGVEALADVTDTTNVVAALTAGNGVDISAGGVVAVSAVALTTVQTAVSEIAQLALSTQEGDVVVRSDLEQTFMHNGGVAGTIADFTLLSTPTDSVTSVDGLTGVVTLDHDSLAGFVANEHVDYTAGGTFGGNIDVTGIVQSTGYLAVEGTTGNTGAAGDRWIGGDGTAGTWFYNVPTGSNHYFAVNNANKLNVNSTGIDVTGTATMDGLTVATTQGSVSIPTNTSSLNFSRAGSNYIRATDLAGSFTFITGANDFATQRLNIANNGDISFYEDTGTTPKLTWDASAEKLNLSGTGGLDVNGTITGGAGQFSGVSGTTLVKAIGADINGNADVEIFSTGTTGSSRLFFSDTAAQSGSIAYSHTTNLMTASSAGDITLDAVGDIILDADGGDIVVRDGGASKLFISNSSDNVLFTNAVQDKDLIFKGYDGASLITALTLDMGAAGAATFNAGVTTGGKIEINGASTAGQLSLVQAAADAYGIVVQASANDSWLRMGHTGTYAQIDSTYNSTAGYTPLQFLTGGSSRMEIDTSGNVGIGTSSPAARLDVVLPSGTNGDIITMARSGGAYDFSLGIDVNSTWYVSNASDEKVFNIDYTGNVGIGTSSPQATLDISSGAGSDTFPILKLGPNSSFGHTFYDSSSTGDLIVKRRVSGIETETIRLARASGNVGIGTDSPSYPLHVVGEAGVELYNATGGGNVLNLRPSLGDANKYNMSISSYDHSGGGVGPSDGISINAFDGVSVATGSSTARQERMRIDASGALLLHPNNSSRGLKITSTTAGTAGDTTTYDTIAAGFGKHVFKTDGIERMRIDASGNVLVGKTALDVGVVGQELRSSGYMAATRDGSTVGSYTRLNSDGVILEFRKDGAAVGSIQSGSGGRLALGHNDTGLYFADDLNAVVPWNITTNAIRDSAIDLGSSGTSFRFKDLHLSGTANLGGLDITTTGSTNLYLQGGDGNSKNIVFRKTTGGVQQAKISAVGDDLRFTTGSTTERMRIDASGDLLVGTTAFAAGGGGQIFTSNGSRSSSRDVTTTAYHNLFYNANGLVGGITTNGSTTSFITSSDYRLKDITGPLQGSGDYIDSLNPVEGTWKADGSVFVGLIAHEADEVSRTKIATGEKDGEEMQGMEYSSSEMIANLIKEVQSLRKRVLQLEG